MLGMESPNFAAVTPLLLAGERGAFSEMAIVETDALRSNEDFSRDTTGSYDSRIEQLYWLRMYNSARTVTSTYLHVIILATGIIGLAWQLVGIFFIRKCM